MPESTTVAVLQSPVSLDEFKAACGRVRDFMEQLAKERGWCSEWHNYLHGIIDAYSDYNREFTWSEYVADGPDTDYMTALDSIRRRVLYFVNEGAITLDTANEAFRSVGLAEHAVPEAVSVQLTGYLPDLAITVTGSADDVVSWAREAVLPAVEKALTSLDRVESVTFTSPQAYLTRTRSPRPTVPEAEIEVPGYH